MTGDKPTSRATLRKRVACSIALLLGLCSSAAAANQEEEPPDQVVLRSEAGGGRISIRCYILEYTGTAIKFRKSLAGDVKTRPAEMVLDVKTRQSNAHYQGLIEFTRNRFDKAQIEFEKALTVESREWVRHELLAQLVRCALKRGDFRSACSRFVLLVRSEPDTRYLELIPLVWGPRKIPDELLSKARDWITESSVAARLIGASILMSEKRYHALAEAALQRLMRASPKSMRDLAGMQYWRKRLRRGNLHESELADWQTQIDQLDEPFRGGPYFLLGMAHTQRRESEQAAAAFLWLPLAYDHDHHLAARACLLAANALNDINQITEARTLYGEITTRFADTRFAQEAKAQLKQIAAKRLSRPRGTNTPRGKAVKNRRRLEP